MTSYSEKEAAETFREIFNQSSDLIYILDENSEFIDVNQTVLSSYGYTLEEVIGTTPPFFGVPGMNDMEIVNSLIEQAWTTGMSSKFEWWSLRKDGSVFPKEIILKKGKYFGKEVLIGTGRDITERKRNEEELLRKTNQLRTLNKELDSFMWKVSHDLKSPLSSIKGIINVTKIEKNPEKIQSYYTHIEQSIEKLNDFIGAMEDITRNTQREVNYTPLDFNTLLDSIMEDFQFNHLAKGVKVKRDVNQTVEFGSDSLLLSSVLNNLMSNSYKYKSENKPRIDIRIEAGESEGVIEVEDNGIGIQQEYLPKVFDMFFRGTNKAKGSGLGLFIVKEAIQKINGTINVQSKEGEGTKFTLRIPNSISDAHL